MHIDQVLLLLLNSLSLKCNKLILSWSAVNLWQKEALNILLENKLLIPVSKATNIQCQVCENHCNVDVTHYQYPNSTHYYAVCEDPFMHEQIGRVAIPPEQLKQWKISIKQLAVLIADLLGLPSDFSYKAEQKSITLGALKSKAAGRKSVVFNIEPLSLVINQSELPISELLYFDANSTLDTTNKLALDKDKIDYALNLKQPSPAKTYRSNIDKQVLRSAKTHAMHQDWQEQATKLNKLQPTKSKTWLSQQIAKLPISQGKSAETIRRNINI